MPELLLTSSATDGTDVPITLAGGRTLGECISAAPKPGCTTRSETDNHQVIVFGVLIAGMAFIGWRVARGVRRGDAQRLAAARAAAAAKVAADTNRPGG